MGPEVTFPCAPMEVEPLIAAALRARDEVAPEGDSGDCGRDAPHPQQRGSLARLAPVGGLGVMGTSSRKAVHQ